MELYKTLQRSLSFGLDWSDLRSRIFLRWRGDSPSGWEITGGLVCWWRGTLVVRWHVVEGHLFREWLDNLNRAWGWGDWVLVGGGTVEALTETETAVEGLKKKDRGKEDETNE